MADGSARICFTVHHRAGTDNANANALSRLSPPSSAISPSPTPPQNDVACFEQLILLTLYSINTIQPSNRRNRL